MENQHRKISGYRELSQAEIDLMNEIKALGPQIEEVVCKVRRHVNDQRKASWELVDASKSAESIAGPSAGLVEVARLDEAQPARWAGIATTHLQQGLMALTRAVAQPTFF